MKAYRIGTRGSDLAVLQASLVKDALEQKGLSCEIVVIESHADKDPKTPLFKFSTQGVFTKKLEEALLENKVDMAVHSYKDLPTQIPSGLKLYGVIKRGLSNDMLIAQKNRVKTETLFPVKPNSKIGTSSLRREALIHCHLKESKVVGLRGNIPTRIQAVREGKVDAVVISAAAIERLTPKMDDLYSKVLPVSLFVPAPAQGVVVIEGRSKLPSSLEEALLSIHDLTTFYETSIERKILAELEGGCTLPLGVFCQKKNRSFNVKSFLGIKKEKWNSIYFECTGLEKDVISQTVKHFKTYL